MQFHHYHELLESVALDEQDRIDTFAHALERYRSTPDSASTKAYVQARTLYIALSFVTDALENTVLGSYIASKSPTMTFADWLSEQTATLDSVVDSTHKNLEPREAAHTKRTIRHYCRQLLDCLRDIEYGTEPVLG